jgi:hypothetical protein
MDGFVRRQERHHFVHHLPHEFFGLTQAKSTDGESLYVEPGRKLGRLDAEFR